MPIVERWAVYREDHSDDDERFVMRLIGEKTQGPTWGKESENSGMKRMARLGGKGPPTRT